MVVELSLINFETLLVPQWLMVKVLRGLFKKLKEPQKLFLDLNKKMIT